MYLPEKDPSYVTKTAMNENIVCLLGGRVAEQLVLDDISTGASNDLQRATDTARAMVHPLWLLGAHGPGGLWHRPWRNLPWPRLWPGQGLFRNTASEIG